MDMQGFDQAFLYYFESLQRPWLDPVAHGVTTLGNPYPMAGVIVTLACLFAWLRRYRFALVIACIGLAAGGLQFGVKHLVNRPRPDVIWRTIDLPSQSSFPSGHAMGSVAVYFGGALLGAKLIASRRIANSLRISGALLGLLVGLSRPYLGVHYPMDIFAGWVGGLVCALAGNAFAGPAQPYSPLEACVGDDNSSHRMT